MPELKETLSQASDEEVRQIAERLMRNLENLRTLEEETLSENRRIRHENQQLMREINLTAAKVAESNRKPSMFESFAKSFTKETVNITNELINMSKKAAEIAVPAVSEASDISGGQTKQVRNVTIEATRQISEATFDATKKASEVTVEASKKAMGAMRSFGAGLLSSYNNLKEDISKKAEASGLATFNLSGTDAAARKIVATQPLNPRAAMAVQKASEPSPAPALPPTTVVSFDSFGNASSFTPAEAPQKPPCVSVDFAQAPHSPNAKVISLVDELKEGDDFMSPSREADLHLVQTHLQAVAGPGAVEEAEDLIVGDIAQPGTGQVLQNLLRNEKDKQSSSASAEVVSFDDDEVEEEVVGEIVGGEGEEDEDEDDDSWMVIVTLIVGAQTFELKMSYTDSAGPVVEKFLKEHRDLITDDRAQDVLEAYLQSVEESSDDFPILAKADLGVLLRD